MSPAEMAYGHGLHVLQYTIIVALQSAWPLGPEGLHWPSGWKRCATCAACKKTCLVYTVVALWCTSDVQGQCQWKRSRGEMEVQDMRAGRGG